MQMEPEYMGTIRKNPNLKKDVGGLGDDKFQTATVEIADRFIERFKQDAETLLGVLDPENAQSVYSLMEDLAASNLAISSKFKGGKSPKIRRRRGYSPYIEEVGPSLDFETAGYQMMD